MKIVDGEEVFGIEDVEYNEEASCGNCYDLEPFTATVQDGCSWCIDCMSYSENFVLTDEDKQKIEVLQAEHRIKYYEDHLQYLRDFLIERGKV